MSKQTPSTTTRCGNLYSISHPFHSPAGKKQVYQGVKGDVLPGVFSSFGKVSICFSGLSTVALTEEEMEGKHLVVSCILAMDNTSLHSYALVDSGATGYGFIDENFVCHHHLPTMPLALPRILEVIYGWPISSGTITHYVDIPMGIGGHEEHARLFVTSLGHYPIVLGIPWLRRHNVKTNWVD
jgi:hypothetical protein